MFFLNVGQTFKVIGKTDRFISNLKLVWRLYDIKWSTGIYFFLMCSYIQIYMKIYKEVCLWFMIKMQKDELPAVVFFYHTYPSYTDFSSSMSRLMPSSDAFKWRGNKCFIFLKLSMRQEIYIFRYSKNCDKLARTFYNPPEWTF